MKSTITFSLLLICTLFFASCSKDGGTSESAESRVARLLTNSGNRVWHLNKVYENTVEVILTDIQKQYTKTFTADPGNIDPLNAKKGTFTDSNGYLGEWTLLNASQIYVKIANNQAGPVAITYIINTISDTMLDIEYTANMKTVREVYYGY